MSTTGTHTDRVRLWESGSAVRLSKVRMFQHEMHGSVAATIFWVWAGIVVIAVACCFLWGLRRKKPANKPPAKYAEQLQQRMRQKPSCFAASPSASTGKTRGHCHCWKVKAWAAIPATATRKRQRVPDLPTIGTLNIDEKCGLPVAAFCGGDGQQHLAGPRRARLLLDVEQQVGRTHLDEREAAARMTRAARTPELIIRDSTANPGAAGA